MKQSFNLLKELVTNLVSDWNEIQAKNCVCIKMEVDEKGKSITLWEDDDPTIFLPITNLFDAIDATNFSYFFSWNKEKERLEIQIY